MKRTIAFFSIVFFISAFFIFARPTEAGVLTCDTDLTGKLIISEVSPNGTSGEWVELFNTDADNSINLSGCAIKRGAEIRVFPLRYSENVIRYAPTERFLNIFI